MPASIVPSGTQMTRAYRRRRRRHRHVDRARGDAPSVAMDRALTECCVCDRRRERPAPMRTANR